MTKKDYRAIAELLHRQRELVTPQVKWTAFNGSSRQNVIDSVANDLCQIFARDNARFDAERFIKAVREGLK